MPIKFMKNEEIPDWIHSKTEIPDNSARAGWEVDFHALEQAIKELNITHTVKVRYSGGRYTIGTHYIKRDTNDFSLYHGIVLSQNKSAETQNFTLLHELYHAYQTERHAEQANQYPRYDHNGNLKPPKTIADHYKDCYIDGVGYRHKQSEKEANDFAHANHLTTKLIKEL
jgi:hypothetical protein